LATLVVYVAGVLTGVTLAGLGMLATAAALRARGR
jgi:hypothetical protein